MEFEMLICRNYVHISKRKKYLSTNFNKGFARMDWVNFIDY